MMTPAPAKLAIHSILNPRGNRRGDVDYARPMRELHALHAKGAVLNKRNWWIKWTSMPEVRAKWLLEMEEALVKAHVAHVWSQWPYRPHLGRRFEGLTKLIEIAMMTDDVEKQAAIDATLANVMYPPGYDRYDAFNEGTHYEEQDDEAEEEWTELEALQLEDAPAKEDQAAKKRKNDEDGDDGEDKEDDEDEEEEEDDDDDEGSYEASAIDTNFKKVLAQHKNMYAVGQIAWFIAMSMVREELRLLLPLEWTRQRIEEITEQTWSSENQEVVVRASSLIRAVVREAPCTLGVLRTLLPDERRPNVLKLLQYHFTKVRAMLDSTKASIEGDLDDIAKALSLGDRMGAEPIHVPGPAPKTWLSDNCIPADLKSKFVAEIAKLEDVPEEAKDWHPKSNDQVLNLVHPSLYCGVAGQTKLLPASEAQNLYSDPAAHMRAIMFAPTPRVLESSVDGFQWLPCEMDVTDTGEARVRTYINNLHPEDYGALYESIGDIFSRFVPLFDQTLSTLVDTHSDPIYPPVPRHSIAGNRCQVIVKIAEIVLTPEKPSYDGGSWHMEGTMAENIVATGLYYFGCENITESRLSFCGFVQQPDYEQSDHAGVRLTYGLGNEKALIQNTGSVTAIEDRCVVFPNILHHKVEPFQLADPTKPGVRKILAFFLVNPTMEPVVSTAIAPPQQDEWATRAQEPALKKLRVPDTVVDQILGLANERMSLELAKEIRLKLMKRRSPVDFDDYGEGDYVFSLCEH